MATGPTLRGLGRVAVFNVVERGDLMEEVVAGQVQACQALAELVEDIPPIPEACRRCPHGGDLHHRRLERFRMLASGLVKGLERAFKAAIEVVHKGHGDRQVSGA